MKPGDRVWFKIREGETVSRGTTRFLFSVQKAQLDKVTLIDPLGEETGWVPLDLLELAPS